MGSAARAMGEYLGILSDDVAHLQNLYLRVVFPACVAYLTAIGAALLFGFFRALSSVYSGIGWLASMKIPSTIYVMLPYIISLIVLAFTSKNSRAPKAEGIPYDKSTR